MAFDTPKVYGRLHMLHWIVHPQQTSGGSVAQLNATVPGLQHDKHTQSVQKWSA